MTRFVTPPPEEAPMRQQLDALRDQTITDIIKREGGYVNNPNDSGCETIFGITAAVARAHGYQGAMKDMPRGTAEDIYRRSFWNALRLDEVGRLSVAIAAEVADTAVNLGPVPAARFLQESLNAFNLTGQLYPDLVVDGVLGSQTIQALGSFLRHRNADGETVLLRALNSLQGAFYLDLVKRREKDEQFVFGWLLHRVHI